MNQIKHIRLDKIKPPEFDSRLTPSPHEDDELRDSIKELGILEPLLVKEVTDGIEIIAGNRRFIQAGRAGLPSVPCIVEKVTGAQSDKIKLHENLKRLPLSHIDQAQTFAYLIKEYKMTETQISTLIGKSIGYVSQHLSLLQSDDKLLQAVHDGRINFSIARELNACKDPDERSRIQDLIEEHGASTPIVHDWVRDSNRETDKIESDPKHQERIYPDITPTIPHYSCAVCNTLTRYDEVKRIYMCPGCHNLFFLEIERDKQRQRIKITTTGDPGCS